MRKYLSNGEFALAAKTAFGFLRDEGFLGPEEGPDQLAYSTGVLGVEVLFDDRDGRVIIIIRGFVGDTSPRAGLSCLYSSAGLGPPQDIRDIARSSKQLKSAVESQAAALRQLLPVLQSNRGPELLLECHGR